MNEYKPYSYPRRPPGQYMLECVNCGKEHGELLVSFGGWLKNAYCLPCLLELAPDIFQELKSKIADAERLKPVRSYELTDAKVVDVLKPPCNRPEQP